MMTVADLQRAAFSLHWHEAVAVIAELASVMQASRLAHVPAPASIAITGDGTLLVSGGSTLEGPPPHALAALLEELLSSASCPPELGQFVAHNLAEPSAHATLEDFASALAFFERPGRRELLKAIAERATEVVHQTRADAELERLAARARGHQDKTGGASPQIAPSRSRRRIVLLVASAAAVLAAIAGVGFLLFETGSTPATITGRVQAGVKQIVQTGLEALGAAKPDVPPPPAQAPSAVSASRAKRRPSPRSSRQVELTAQVNERGGAPILEPILSDEPALSGPPMDNATVYSADADGVEPAVLMRPHLPSQPPHTVPPEHVGVLELLVTETGAVDHVRLISPGDRYHDRMIVAAAKAWRFRPATKDGHPVRSRIRIRVTL